MEFGWSSRSPSEGGKRRQRRGASSSERAIHLSPMGKGRKGPEVRMHDLKRSGVLALVITISALAVIATPGDATTFANRTLDGSGNNVRNYDWGRSNTLYLRVAP